MLATELLVGDAAPALHVSEFVKGAPVTGFEPGKIYVVEFWATWCGPCRAGIPHLTAIQAERPSIVVLGVAVQDELDKVRDFVSEQGDAMGYTIAMDAAPGPEERAGPTYRAWCEAAYQMGIPTAFIVDGEGMIAWIGHPMKIDEPLAAVVEGRWDRAAETASHKDGLARDKVRETATMFDALGRCEPNDEACAVGVLDATFVRHPELERKYGCWKLRHMIGAERSDACDYARHLIALDPDERNESLVNVGLTFAGLIEDLPSDGKPFDPAIVAFAHESLREAAGIDWPDDDDFRRMDLEKGLAVTALAAGRPGEALAHARAARELAVKGETPPEGLQRFDALIERCSAGAASVSSAPPGVVCEDGICRIVPA